MSLAVRSAVMEHYKSTLATTACAVFGLLAAAHILHPGNYEEPVRPTRPAVASAVAPIGPSAWADPPARIAASTPGPTASGHDGPGLPEPRLSAALPPGAAAVQALPAEMAAPAERTARAETMRRPKTARRAARPRHAAVARTAQADRPALGRDAVAVPAPPAAGRIDPIGDLIRGLGLGRDG